jgi:hypothetical protein
VLTGHVPRCFRSHPRRVEIPLAFRCHRIVRLDCDAAAAEHLRRSAVSHRLIVQFAVVHTTANPLLIVRKPQGEMRFQVDTERAGHESVTDNRPTPAGPRSGIPRRRSLRDNRGLPVLIDKIAVAEVDDAGAACPTEPDQLELGFFAVSAIPASS